MSIKKKLITGFTSVIVFLIITGVFGGYGIVTVIGNMEEISQQLVITKDINRALVDAGDAQAHALRLIIYKEQSYMDNMSTEVEAVIHNAEEASSLMKSRENKDNVDHILKNIESYHTATNNWWNIQIAKQEAGAVRADAAKHVLDLVKEIIDIEIEYAKEQAGNRNSISLDYFDKIMALQEIRNATNRFRVSAQKYQIAVTPEQQDAVALVWMSEIQVVDDLLTEADAMMTLPTIKQKIAEAHVAIDDYREEVMTFRERNLQQRAEQVQQKESAQLSMNAGRTVRDGVYDHIIKTEESADKSASLIIWLIVIIIVVSAIIAAVIAFYITQGIIHPINKAVDFAGLLEAGDLDSTLEEADDELGKIAKALNSLVVVMNDRATIVKNIADGNLHVDVNVTSEQDRLGKSLVQMVENLNSMIGEVSQVTQEVDTGALQINSASNSLSEGAVDSASSIEEISASIAEMETQTKGNATNAEKANSIATETVTAAQQGQHKMEEMITAMNLINDNSDQMQKVITTINDIAFQTNLLALNAAVEAARAGQYGKGFAVVADEVRNLAGRSATASKETADLIQKSSNEIENGVQISKETAEALNLINENVQSTNQLISEISDASNGQASGIQEINAALSQVDTIIQQNAANAEETASASTEMSAQSESLMTLVAGFTLKDEYQAKLTKPNLSLPNQSASSNTATPDSTVVSYRDESGYGEY